MTLWFGDCVESVMKLGHNQTRSRRCRCGRRRARPLPGTAGRHSRRRRSGCSAMPRSNSGIERILRRPLSTRTMCIS